jgi:hypothetical protein
MEHEDSACGDFFDDVIDRACGLRVSRTGKTRAASTAHFGRVAQRR